MADGLCYTGNEVGMLTVARSTLRRAGSGPSRTLRAHQSTSPLRIALASAAVAAGLLVAPAAQARQATFLSLDVTFSSGGAITMTLPDGTPVGVAGGSPTVIPAGYYTLFFTGPGGCTTVPYFELKGPGVNVSDDLDEGETNNDTATADLSPSSTYQWTNTFTSAVYTFQTNASVVGTPSSYDTSGYAVDSSGTSGTASSSDLVGSSSTSSSATSLRGSLTGAVSAAGKLSLVFKGRSVSVLAAGHYTVTVTDKSTRTGLVLEHGKAAPVMLATKGFVGKHTMTVNLTAGQWFYAPHVATGSKTYFVVS
jgi:hypothetical protein